ncbi:hypothetical protein [Jatrophihabitans sp.]|uniref:hypothetical protein n=1 Tax=Jatrophihabitans sp. TaxID=1932789 RepID=UPI003F7FBF57
MRTSLLRLRRRVVALALRLGSFVASVRWILLSLVLATVGVVGVYVAIPLALNLALAVVSAVLALLEIRAFRARQAETQFQPRTTDTFEDVRTALAGCPRFEFFDYVGGTFVYDRVASTWIDDPSTEAAVRSVDYVLPAELREAGRLFQRRRVSGNAHAYNDVVLGLDTDVGYGSDAPPKVLTVVAGRYWDYLASDTFAMHEVVVRGHRRTDLGRPLVFDRDGRPRDFASSWLFNGIGLSVLAITTDGRFVVVTQSLNNDSSQGLFAPTGSGAAEPKDFRGAAVLPARDLFRNGALREAAEESGIGEHEVASTAVLGFGRWLQKSAAPEVLLVALLSIDSHEVRRRAVPALDRPYTVTAEPERFIGPPSSWRADDLSTMVERRLLDAMSLPLGASLSLLARAVGQGHDPVAAEVLRRCG